MMALTRGCRRVLRLNSIRKDGAISNRGWARKFDDPIPVAKGKELVTLRDAALYITKLPKELSPNLGDSRAGQAAAVVG
jgi:hypothetical protein